MKGRLSYYAQFVPAGDDEKFRLDTRIYLDDCDSRRQDDKECVAAVVLKNPGKATSGSNPPDWEQLILDGDNTLPLIQGIFFDAYAKAGKPIPKNAFIQVWNLYYLCNHDASAAFASLKKIPKPPPCPSEGKCKPKIVWFAWGKCNSCSGSDIKHFDCLKRRFRLEHYENSFYYGHAKSTKYVAGEAKIFRGVPSDDDFAKHPQRLMNSTGYSAISDHLKQLL
jgi:hypothetical protein